MNSDRWASYVAGGYYVVNNIWNDQLFGNGKQSLHSPQGNSFSWDWDWHTNPTYTPVSYPSVIFGNKPWDPQGSSTKTLPRQVSKINRLTATHDYVLKTNGRYNVAYDLWLTEGEQPSIPKIRVEIMVWIESSGNVQPYGVFEAENENYALYVGKPDQGRNWSCYSFKLKHSLASTTVNLGEYIQQLMKTHGVSPDLYLADVEFGTEIWDGQGQMTIHSYQVSVA